MILASSIISADFARLGEQVRRALDAGADWLHVDVMDGRFVPNITIGPLVVESLRPIVDEFDALLDVHLMILEPERYVGDFTGAGADVITVHVEATRHLHRTIHQIKEQGARAGVTLNPATPLSTLEDVLPDVDLALIMSVNPGFSGQSYIQSSTGKIRRLRRMLDEIGSGAHLEVDGGVGAANVLEVVRAGASAVVAGNAVFGGSGDIEANIQAIRHALIVEA